MAEEESDTTPRIEKKLTPRQKMFVEHYAMCFNASEAARRAGYSEKNAADTGHDLIRNPQISRLIREKVKQTQVSADEALSILALHARGDIAELMDISSVGFNLDMAKAKEKGLTRLIKRVRQKTTTFLAKSESGEDREVTELEIELYDAQSAVDKILRAEGAYKDASPANVLIVPNLDDVLKKIYGTNGTDSGNHSK